MLSLIITFSIAFAENNLSDNECNSTNDSKSSSIHIIANDDQLRLLNSMNLKEMTLGEIMEQVFPNEYMKLNTSSKMALKGMQSGHLNKNDDESLTQDAYSLTFGSSISMYGNSLVHSSYSNPSFISKEVWVDSQLYNIHTNNIVSFCVDYATQTDYVSVTGYAEPPTGTYAVFANHYWKYKDTYGNYVWMHLVSSTSPRSYVNPFRISEYK